MVDFAQLRRSMVDGQIRVNDVTDPRIVAAMLELPRERFVPASVRQLAYIDDDLPVRPGGPGQPGRYLMEPMVLAKLVQALDLESGHKVLDVGTATGYSAALLGRLVRMVVALEEERELAAAAASLLAELGAVNVNVMTGTLAAGWPSEAPYDAILLNGAVEVVPQALLQQLKEGGRLGAVMRSGAAGRATIHSRVGNRFAARAVFDASVPPLPGFAAPKSFMF
jgi:protein-L-isoaspartate(D-aspartate) O-methyltransferase